MTPAARLLRPLIAALLPLVAATAVVAQEPAPAAEPEPPTELAPPEPTAAPAASASAPRGGIPPQCLAPGADKRVNLACALGYLRHATAERAAGHTDIALSDLAKADQFEPNDLRFAVAHAGLRLAAKAPASPERLKQALRDTPDDVGVNMLHGEMSLASRKFDDAIADAGRVIAQRPDAHGGYELRGTARFAKSDVDGATADVTQALRLSPRSPDALRLRASITTVSGRYDDALADLQLAHRIEPRADDPFLIGGTQFLARQFTSSAASLAKPSAGAGDGAYWLLWRYMALARAEGPEPARGSLGPGSIPGYTAPWPMPVIDFYLGRLDGDKLLEAARAAQANDDQSQVCEAHFYLGEDALLRFRRAEALDLFRMTIAECPPAFHEYVGAQAELKALTAQDAAVAPQVSAR